MLGRHVDQLPEGPPPTPCGRWQAIDSARSKSSAACCARRLLKGQILVESRFCETRSSGEVEGVQAVQGQSGSSAQNPAAADGWIHRFRLTRACNGSPHQPPIGAPRRADGAGDAKPYGTACGGPGPELAHQPATRSSGSCVAARP